MTTPRSGIKPRQVHLSGINVAAPAPAIVRGMARTLRQLAKSTIIAEHPIELSVDAAVCFEKSLIQRSPKLSAQTFKIYFQHLKTFGTYSGACEHLIQHLASRIRFYAKRATRCATRVDIKTMQVPDCKGVLQAAFKLLAEASTETNLTTANALRNRSAAIALVSVIPLRSADLCSALSPSIPQPEIISLSQPVAAPPLQSGITGSKHSRHGKSRQTSPDLRKACHRANSVS